MLFLEIFVGILAAGPAVAFPAIEDNSASTVKRASKFQWVGTNQAGAEFGNLDLPGTLGKHYTWPVHSSIDVSYHDEPVGLQADSISDPDGQGLQYLSNRVHDVISLALLHKPILTQSKGAPCSRQAHRLSQSRLLQVSTGDCSICHEQGCLCRFGPPQLWQAPSPQGLP